MPQLYIAAAVTSLIAICLFGALIRQLTGPNSTGTELTVPKSIDPKLIDAAHRRKLLCLGCLGLCMSPLAYFFVRLPLIPLVEPALLGTTLENPKGTASTAVLSGVRLLYAPLTEEPFKLLPWLVLLIFGVLRKPTRKMVVPIALTIGVSFAIGEFWLVAYLIAAKPDPALAELPWYAFGGYMSERLMTCFTHTLFALPTIFLYRRSRLLAACGLVVGMILHYLGNSPIALMQQNAFGLSTPTWSAIVTIWLSLFVLATVWALVAVHFGNEVLARIWQNKMICPECGATYRQSILIGINMGTGRYEPCGACLKWHWVTIANLAPLENPETVKSPHTS